MASQINGERLIIKVNDMGKMVSHLKKIVVVWLPHTLY